jgi:hypothetical protein
MIRLKTLLSEITFGTSEPYVDKFVWHEYQESFRTSFKDDVDNTIDVVFDQNVTLGYDEDASYELSFWVNKSYDANKANAGQANYIRIMATIAAALYSFINYADYPHMIEFSGSDSDPEKAAQKARLYQQFATTNKTKLADLGYRFVNSHMGTGIERID